MEKIVSRDNWVDNLRSFITLLVIAHHSSLAYATFGYFNKYAYITSTNPIVDEARWKGLDVFIDFNDIFFMSLMFLISGIFVMQSIQHKLIKKFVTDRFLRLFIPFMAGVTILMLLAYYPAYYMAYGKNDVKAYVIDFFTIEAWPVGPPWFIWVLFLFNLIFAIVYPLVKNTVIRSGAFLAAQKQRPLKLFILWALLTWVVYVPIVLLTGPGAWTGIGPFDFQISRFVMYFSYFLLGILIGAPGLKNGLFSEDAAFVKKWPLWMTAALLVFTLLKLSEAPLTSMVKLQQLHELPAHFIYRSIWTLSCTLSCISFLTMFRALFNQTNSWWRSLSANAYGMYLVHYIFVVWSQFYLLQFHLPPVIKFLLSFMASVILSWLLTYLIRRNNTVRKYL